MKLSNRLKMIATLVDVGVKVIDVGCDHGYLDIYLTENNDNNCLAIDINKNALESAKNNIRKHKLNNKIETKLNDGLKGIKVCEEDTIILSGLGTATILKILNNEKLSDTIIISSNNNIEELRYGLINLGYYIESEIFLYDKNKPYVIIKFKKGVKKYFKNDIKYGPILRKNLQYKSYLIKRNNKKFNNISKFKLWLKFKIIIENLKIKHFI